jgi:hypothetical protein
MKHKHLPAWRYRNAMDQAEQVELPADMDEVMKQKLRLKIFNAIHEAETLSDLMDLARFLGDSQKLGQAERKVRVLEDRLRLEIYAAQHAAAAEVDAILAEAEKLKALQLARQDATSNNVSEAERIERIRLRLYGPQAVPNTQPEGKVV